jgi:hypothetical protein
VLAAIFVAGCIHHPAASTSAPGEGCQQQIMVTLAGTPDGEPGSKLVTDLAHTAAVELEYLRAVSPGTFVFSLTADGSDSGCRDALERLRHDPRIRSVEVDAPRKTHAP